MASAFLESDCVGRTIDGRFTLLRWLGGTGQSSVFLTELAGDSPRKAAIKFTPANAADAETRIAQWADARSLSHPHLVRVFDAGSSEVDGVDLLYVVTDYADEVLSELLRERSLTAAETWEMLPAILDSLSWLHSRKLVHGHLKPSNVLVVDDQLKLSADRLHIPGRPGWTSSSSGKYDAPEATTFTMSPAADVWSLGIVLVEALTQRSLRWDGRTGDPAVPGFMPQPFLGIARECLRVDPTHRITINGIREALQSAPAPKSSPSVVASASRVLRSGPRPTKTQLLIAGAVVAVGAIVTTLVLTHHPSSPSPAPQASTTVAPAPAPETPAATPPPRHRSSPPATQPHASAPVTPAQSSAPPSQPPQAQIQPQQAQPRPLQSQPPAGAVSGAVVKGTVANQVTPDIPQHILDSVTGHIRIRVAVQVDSSGNVTDATLDLAGPSQYFANKALAAARNWKFTAAQAGGRPVASQWILHFSFGQDGTTVTPAETTP